MRILLFLPESSYYCHSLGLAWIHSYLSKNPKLQIDFADLNSPVDFKHYDLVGMSIHTENIRSAVKVLTTIKTQSPTTRCVAGGPHPSLLPYQMLEAGFDQVVVGVGHRCLAAITEGETATILHGDFSHLSDLRYPRFSDQSYTEQQIYGTMSSFGCPFHCAFCSSAALWKHQWLARNLDVVIEEILWALKQKPHIQRIFLLDDNFTLHHEHVRRFCELFSAKVLTQYPHLTWQAFSKVESITKELCQLMKKTRCTQLFLGIESASPVILETIGKKTTTKDQHRAIQLLQSSGIIPVTTLIVGLPGETQMSIDATASFIRTHRLLKQQCLVYKAAIYPGSYLYTKAQHHGFDPTSYLTQAPVYTYEHSDAQLSTWKSQLEATML